MRSQGIRSSGRISISELFCSRSRSSHTFVSTMYMDQFPRHSRAFFCNASMEFEAEARFTSQSVTNGENGVNGRAPTEWTMSQRRSHNLGTMRGTQ